MLVKPSKLVNTVRPYGKTGNISNSFNERFRTFSVHNVSGTCEVIIDENVMMIPVGLSVNFDAGSDSGVINKFTRGSFRVNADDCIIIGTL